MKTASIRQVVTFNTTAGFVYDMLMDEKKHAALTGAKAAISKKINGKVSLHDGYITGYNIELQPGKEIVQACNFAEDGWPEDHFSICTFSLQQNGRQTKLVFRQTGIPLHKLSDLKSGWKEYYWRPMKIFINSAGKKIDA